MHHGTRAKVFLVKTMVRTSRLSRFSDSAILAMEEHVLKNVRDFCNKSIRKDNFGFGDETGLEPHARSASLHLDKILFRSLAIAKARYEAFSKKQEDHRIARGTMINTKDVFYFLQEGIDLETGENFTLDELVAEASLLILGSTDTTSTAISSTIFYLLHNPSCLTKLANEIRTTFDHTEEIRGGSKLSNCRYLRACIDEVLSMSPGVGGILLREVLPGGITIGGVFYPPGDDIGVPIYAL
ncbi:MAG: hypothetical protein Q9217_002737 [Psora testacea]